MIEGIVSPESLAYYKDAIWHLLLLGGPAVAVILGFNVAFFALGAVQEMLANRASSGPK